MKNFKVIAAGLLVTAFAGVAQAQDASDLSKGGLFLEPAITYQTGTTEVSYPIISSTSDEDVKGFGLGLRLGAHVYESIFVAADARYARPQYESSAFPDTVDATAYNAGVTVGAQTPFYGIRVWGTYILTGELDPSGLNNGPDVKFTDLKGYRVGAGIYVSSVSLNIEYQDAKYDSTTVQDAGGLSGNLDSIDGHDKSYVMSVSFPVSL